MKNLTLKYEKAFDLKKSFDNRINIALTVKQNSNALKNDQELFKQIILYTLDETGIDQSNYFELLNHTDGVEFDNQNDFILSLFLYASHFTNSGKIRIEIDSFLVDQLNNTNLDEICMHDLIFPFNSFYLNLNEFFYTFSNKNSPSNFDVKIEGVYVVKTEQELEFTFITNNKRLNFLRVTFPVSENELNILIASYSTIKCNTQEELEKYFYDPLVDEKLEKNASIHYDLSELSHLIFSIILYLSSFWEYKEDRIIKIFDYDKVKLKHHEKNNPQKFAIKRSNAENIIKLKMTEEEITENRRDKLSYKLQYLFLVRGHWRKQPIGKKEENKHKIKWIKPFWKGEGDLLGKTYKVSQNQ